MKIYRFNDETGVYLGEDFADENPLMRGSYLIPHDATTMAPPQFERGEAPIFDLQEQRWKVRPLAELKNGLLRDRLENKVLSEEFS
jgi:hypothetical protein